jgi:KUP system potassium uptake protein
MDNSEKTKTFSLPMLAALGVVYGDIGTSPLYAFKISLLTINSTDKSDIIGILSIIIWLLFLVISVKYILFILKADNQGEGGAFALLQLAKQQRKGILQKVITFAGIIGACLFYGDSVITPAISVLSALEGISIIDAGISHLVLPLAVLVIILLFSLQFKGTQLIGKLFGPIMLLWFSTLAILGIDNILRAPEILVAFNPWYALKFILQHQTMSFILLGAIVLTVTGAEALYADMGHFGKKAIARAWTMLVFPALILCYLGQGALLLVEPTALSNPFFHLAPSYLQFPLVILATLATIIASQAVISGAYSMTAQAIHLNYLPKMTIKHTSSEEKGQIYLPLINHFLAIMVLLLIVTFQSSESLAQAYGMAVTGSMLITTFLAFFVLVKRYQGLSRYGVTLSLSLFLVLDLFLFSANTLKIFEGGWLPILVAVVIYFIMHCWIKGRRLMMAELYKNPVSLRDFMQKVESDKPLTVSGCAIFLNSLYDSPPLALIKNLKYNSVIYEKNIFITLVSSDAPYILPIQRIALESITENSWQIRAQYGFKETVDLQELIDYLNGQYPEIGLFNGRVSYFLSQLLVLIAPHSKLFLAEKMLFSTMSKLSIRSTRFYNIPPDEVIEIGVQVEI